MPRKKIVRTERDMMITDSIYEHAKGRGMDVTGIYASTLKRVRELMEATKDPDQVELVCLTVLDQDNDFVAWKSLSWNTYEYFRDQMDLPKGSWLYALAGYHAPEKWADGIGYLIQCWRDAEGDDDSVECVNIKNKLERLMDKMFEELLGEPSA